MTLIGGVVVHDGHGRRWSGLRIEGDRVAELLSAAPSGAIVDFGGAHLLPPLVDTHLHLVAIGQARLMVDARRSRTLDALGAALRDVSADETGTRFALHFESTRQTPDPEWFDTIGGRVVLLTPDLHAAWVSPQVFLDAGVTADSPDPIGGAFQRTASGGLSGYVLDSALDVLSVRFATDDPVRTKRFLKVGISACESAGLHEVHEIATTPTMWRALRELAVDGALGLNVCCYGFGDREAWLNEDLSAVGRLGFCGFKVFLDGAMGSRGAWLSEPYSDARGNRGACLCSAEELARWWQTANALNLQLACHAIGDEAVTLALDGARGCEDRLRIEHAQIVKPSDRSRFRGVVAAMQPHHRRDDAEILESRLGERAHWAFPFEALRHAGATVCFGSDAPVSNLSPLEGMAAAAEAGVSDPLRGYTLEAMRASRAGRSGAIEPGAPADFTVVNVAPGRSGGRVLERWRDGEALASESRILA